MHYARVRRYGNPDIVHKNRASQGKSLVPKCHPDRKWGGNGLCHSCYVTKWSKDNPDKGHAAWVSRNPGYMKKLSRKISLRDNFGLTTEDFDVMWEAQGGRCANKGCDYVGNKDSLDHRRDGLSVDHDHETGRIRGLLCSNCNKALGLLKDDAYRIMGLASYVEESEELDSLIQVVES